MQATFNQDGTVTLTIPKETFFQKFNEQPEDQKLELSQELEVAVTQILGRLGVPRNIKGFNYLREAILMSVEERAYIDNITKKLYPDIAANHDDRSSCVERAIRHAIEVMWSDKTAKDVNLICGCKYLTGDRKPSNSELIAVIADCVRLNQKTGGSQVC